MGLSEGNFTVHIHTHSQMSSNIEFIGYVQLNIKKFNFKTAMISWHQCISRKKFESWNYFSHGLCNQNAFEI